MVHTLIKALIAVFIVASSQAQAMTVFACEPEWAALVKTLVPEATVRTATTHLQDPHHIEARPSLIAQLRGADFAICTGAELEAGWLPMLQDRAGNPKVQNGRPGMFYAAQHVDLIDPFKGTITPFSGDVHAQGNPHFHTDPRRLLLVAKALAGRLGQLFPDKKPQVDQNLAKFETEMSRRIVMWEKQAAPLKGRTVITQHASFGYVWAWLGIKPIADLEPRPGVPPTASHLERVIALSKTQQPAAIVIAQHHDPKPGRWLANSMGMESKLLILPATVPDEQPDSIIRWFDQLMVQLSGLAK
jgi:zinc/manganese transport system substrate-binding protein